MPEYTLQLTKDQQRSQLHEDIKFLEGELGQANEQLNILSIEDYEKIQTEIPLPPPNRSAEYIALRQEDRSFHDFFTEFTRIGRILGLTDHELAKDVIDKVSGRLRFALRDLHVFGPHTGLREIQNYLGSIETKYQPKTTTVSQDSKLYGYTSSSSSDAGPDDCPTTLGFVHDSIEDIFARNSEHCDPEDSEDDDPDQECESEEDNPEYSDEDDEDGDQAEDDNPDYSDEDEDDPYDHDEDYYQEGYL